MPSAGDANAPPSLCSGYVLAHPHLALRYLARRGKPF
jgi:hypothetical protein